MAIRLRTFLAESVVQPGQAHLPWPNSDYLGAIAAVGVDVNYLLTGEVGTRLGNADEQRVVAGFRALGARERKALLALIDAFVEPPQQ